MKLFILAGQLGFSCCVPKMWHKYGEYENVVIKVPQTQMTCRC